MWEISVITRRIQLNRVTLMKRCQRLDFTHLRERKRYVNVQTSISLKLFRTKNIPEYGNKSGEYDKKAMKFQRESFVSSKLQLETSRRRTQLTVATRSYSFSRFADTDWLNLQQIIYHKKLNSSQDLHVFVDLRSKPIFVSSLIKNTHIWYKTDGMFLIIWNIYSNANNAFKVH